MKRLLLAVIALLSFGGPALAQAMAPGEIALTIEVLGLASPDQAIVTQTLRGRGADEAKSKADLAKQRAALTGSLAKLGIPATAIKFGDIEMQPDYSARAIEGAAAAASDAADAAADAAGQVMMDMPDPPRMATQTVTVTVSDLAKIAAVTEALPMDDEYSRRAQTRYSTGDLKAAHTRAVADALAKARAEADAYAAALGMRVVRIVSVSSEKQGLNWPDLMQWFGKMDDRGSPSEDNFMRLAGSTFAGAKVEFVIAPK